VKRALVTGATGMLGSHIVERLVADGWEVRALVRDTGPARWLEPLGASLARGDVTDEASVRAAATACQAVFHAAAAIGPGRDMGAFRALNVAGTEHVIRAAASAGARLIHVSSTAVYDDATRLRFAPVGEDVPVSTLPEGDAYGRSKQEAEAAVLRAHAQGVVWASVVRPPVMYGKRDRQFVPRIAPVLRRGLFPLIDGGRSGFLIVHAGSVADGAVRAATTDAAGGRVYHLTNDFEVTVAEFARFAGEGLGRRILTPSVPLAVARAFFGALGFALTLAGRADLAVHAPGSLALLSRGNPFTSARARRELGWSPAVPPSVGLPEAFRWWNERYGSVKATT
jgi:nucleoside-diphosphate-sugar epimerase